MAITDIKDCAYCHQTAFLRGVYPLILMAKQHPALAMMMSLYVTLGFSCFSLPAPLPRTAA